MIKFIKKFRKDEEGAVTVDWVVLTAAVVGLGVAGVASVSDGVGLLADKISSGVEGQSVGTGG
ncbi:hypothetical protein PVV74_12600 [Roseovarius sp. SK2]|uniref:Flp family type IVb pilin n=1 Tax=Roseovarius TaxID=74030 RepID=UPI00237B17B2|nr:hypothetical protein [Roseovarius sp. SK2]MDD9726301.1 hypothetical protein [Roseovarius sp. SK2]